MTTEQIERRIETIENHLQQADEGKHVTGNLILAITQLLEINKGLLDRIGRIENLQIEPF